MNTMTFIHGEPKVGKSHTAIRGWPDPLHIDTAYTQMEFADSDIMADRSGKGETWPVVNKLLDDPEDHYHYLTEFKQPDAFLDEQYESIIIDNVSDLRTMAAARWAEQKNTDWPMPKQWGGVNNMVKRFVQGLKLNGKHVVVVAQYTDEYENDSKTGERKPDVGSIDFDYMTDFELEIRVTDENERKCLMTANRRTDTTKLEMPMNLGATASLDTLLSLADVPEGEW